jgi:septum formation topological specificity factor MinE
MTLKERIKVVFRDLRRNGFIARMNLENSNKDNINIILNEYNKSDKKAIGVVFCTKQDMTKNKINIRYFHPENNDKKIIVGKEICKQLDLHCLDYEWNGNSMETIIVHG